MDRVNGAPAILVGKLVRGHRVASGLNRDPKFPGGSLAMQVPFFRERGLDLGGWPMGTLNVSIAPSRTVVRRPKVTFRAVKWHPTEPAEDFSFFDASIRSPKGEWVDGLVYYPHPETKPAHLQPPGLIEVLASRWIDGLGYGDAVELVLNPEQIAILPSAVTGGTGHSQP